MLIPQRQLLFVPYRTDADWLAELPVANWLCVLLADEAPRRYLDEVLPKLLLRNVAWVCCAGRHSERVHDLLDDEIVFSDMEQHYLPPHPVVTTWHEQIAEALEFARFTAYHETVSIEHVAVLDLTGGTALV
jgi:hypothetical protein